MAACLNPDHERFWHVLFCKNGCIACELEATAKQNKLWEELALSYNELLKHYDRYADGRIPPTSLIARLRYLRDELGLNQIEDGGSK